MVAVALIVGGCVLVAVLVCAMCCCSCWLLRRSDTYALSRAKERAGVSMLYVSNGYSLAYRFTVPANPSKQRRYPVVIPNGLAATMVTVGRMHEALVEAGFSVLSYDRVGVGFSETDARQPTVESTITDMHEVMEACAPGAKWILLGPSMGSVVAMCYMLRHPDRSVGFLNLDGFPAPFSCKREKFAGAATPYAVFSKLAAAGMMRPGLFLAARFTESIAATATNAFPPHVFTAQMNQSKFWSNTAKEFMLMIDLAEEATRGWGALDVLRMGEERQAELSRIPPANHGDYDEFEKRWTRLPDRSNAELGPDWLTAAEAVSLAEELRPLIEESPLARILAGMPVRVMSARDYNYFGGDSFYDADMKRFAAAEHSLHQLVGDRARRYVFPQRSHMNLFQSHYAVQKCACEIDEEMREAEGSGDCGEEDVEYVM